MQRGDEHLAQQRAVRLATGRLLEGERRAVFSEPTPATRLPATWAARGREALGSGWSRGRDATAGL